MFGRQFSNSVGDRLEGSGVERWHQLAGDWHGGGGRGCSFEMQCVGVATSGGIQEPWGWMPRKGQDGVKDEACVSDYATVWEIPIYEAGNQEETITDFNFEFVFELLLINGARTELA